MKKILILAAAAAVLCSCDSKNKYTVEGTVAGANKMVYLFDEEEVILDSAVVKEGKFRLSASPKLRPWQSCATPATRGRPSRRCSFSNRDGSP